MSDASFQYRLIISSPDADVVNVTDIMVESHTFNSLPSGTPFIVSVQTVGIMRFVSEKAQIQKVTTSKELKLKTGYILQFSVAIVPIFAFLIPKDRSMLETSPLRHRKNPSLLPGQNPSSTRKPTASI